MSFTVKIFIELWFINHGLCRSMLIWLVNQYWNLGKFQVLQKKVKMILFLTDFLMLITNLTAKINILSKLMLIWKSYKQSKLNEKPKIRIFTQTVDKQVRKNRSFQIFHTIFKTRICAFNLNFVQFGRAVDQIQAKTKGDILESLLPHPVSASNMFQLQMQTQLLYCP